MNQIGRMAPKHGLAAFLTGDLAMAGRTVLYPVPQTSRFPKHPGSPNTWWNLSLRVFIA